MSEMRVRSEITHVIPYDMRLLEPLSMIGRNIARIALPKMLVGLFVARVDDDQMEESRETTKRSSVLTA